MSDAKTSLYSSSEAEIVEIVCEGPIRGWANSTPEESVYFDNTPVKEDDTLNFEDVEIDYTLGTQDQAYIPQKLGAGSSSTKGFTQVLDASSGAVTKTTESQYADRATVIIKLPGGLYHTQSDGDIKRNTVSVKIEVKAANVSEFMRVDFGGRDIINGKTTAPYERAFTFPLEPYGDFPYDIRVTKTAEDQQGKNMNAMVWQSLTETVSTKLRYPNSVVVRTLYNANNIQNIPTRGFQIYGLIVDVPSNYDPLTRTYSGDWNGSTKRAWTDNPAWIYYDMVTNPRYGLGDLLDKTLINRTTLYAIGKHCDELIDRGDGVLEPRFTCSVYLQSAQDAYKVISDLASVFRGMIYYTGGEVYTVSDMPSDPVAQYTPANVVDGMFNYTSSARATRYTAVLVQWNDPENNFESTPEYVEDQSAIVRYGLVEKSVRAIGTLSRYQARRVGRYMLLSSLLETEVVTFKVGMDAMFAMPGQLIKIYDPIKSKHTQDGGRLLTTSASSVTLDREVVLQTGESYTLSLIQPDGIMVEASVTLPAGTYYRGYTIPLDYTFSTEDIPLVESVWVLIADSKPWKLHRLLGITEEKSKSSSYFSLTASVYDETKLALVDIGEPLDSIPPPQYDSSGISPISNLVVREGLVYRSDIMERFIELSWQPSPGPYLANYIIEIASPDGFTRTNWPVPNHTMYRVSPGEYSFTIYAVDIRGKLSTGVSAAITIKELPPVGYALISGLELEGQGVNYEFAGRNPVFDWRVTSVVDQEIGAELIGGSAGNDPWFESYEIRILNEDGTLRRTDYSPTPKYTYTFENNTLDGGTAKATRAFTFSVAARDKYGRTGEFVSIDVYNTPPTEYRQLNIAPGYESIIISYLPPDDIDYEKTRVYLSETSGFVPDNINLSNMVYEGDNVIIIIPGLIGPLYYLKLEGVDSFGPAGVFSSEFQSYTSTSLSLSNNLRQKITESYLYQGLLERIDKIDGTGPGSVNERISTSTELSIKTYYQDSPPDPTSASTGDLWFDISDNNHPYRFDGSAVAGPEPGSQWIDVRDASASGVNSFYQDDPPNSGMATGDLWFDTDDENHPYRYDGSLPAGPEPGSRWVDIRDGLIVVNASDVFTLSAQINDPAEGLAVIVQDLGVTVTQQGTTIDAHASSIDSIQASVDTKTAVYVQETQPNPAGGLVDGDLWIQPSANNSTKAWDEPTTQWVDVNSSGNSTMIVTSDPPWPDGAIAGDLLIDGRDNDSDGQPDNEPYTWDGAAWDQQNQSLFAAIQVEADARATTDGIISAEYTIKVNANSHVAGMGILVAGDESGAIESNVLFMADRFSVTYPTIEFSTGLTLVIGQYVRPSDEYIDANGDPGYAYRVTVGGVTTTEPSWPVSAGQYVSSNLVWFYSVNYAELVPFTIGQSQGASTVVMDTAFIGDLSVDTLQIKGQAVTTSAVDYVAARAVFIASPGNAGNFANGSWRTLLQAQTDAGPAGKQANSFLVTSGAFELEFLTVTGSNSGTFYMQARIVKSTEASNPLAGSIVNTIPEYDVSLTYDGTTSNTWIDGVMLNKRFYLTMYNGNRTYLVPFAAMQIAVPNSATGLQTYYLQVRGYSFGGGNLTFANIYKRTGTNLFMIGTKK